MAVGETNGALTFICSVIESVHILDCYRVVLLQRPSGASPRLTNHVFTDQLVGDVSSSGTPLLEALFTPGVAADNAKSDGPGLNALSTIAVFVHPAIPGAIGRNQAANIWRSEFVELALNSWAEVRPRNSISDLLLYRMIHISLHTNLELLQAYAHCKSHNEAGPGAHTVFKDAEEWVTSLHYEIAQWHATRILLESHSCLTERGKGQDTRGSSAQSDARPDGRLMDAPHVPYCIYYATLVLWCGSTLSSEWPTVQALHLGTSSYMLALLKVRVAGILANALSENED